MKYNSPIQNLPTQDLGTGKVKLGVTDTDTAYTVATKGYVDSKTTGGSNINIGGVCFEARTVVSCAWNWSGTGNDTALYIQNNCPDGRTLIYQTKMLVECNFNRYTWNIGAWGAWNNVGDCGMGYQPGGYVLQQTRSVTCMDNVNNTTVNDSTCGTKPITVQESRSCYRDR